MAVGGYDGMRVIYEALKKTKGAGRRRGAARRHEGPDLREPARPDARSTPQTRDIVQNIYIRKVEKVDGQLYNVEFDDPERQGSGEGGEEVASSLDRLPRHTGEAGEAASRSRGASSCSSALDSRGLRDPSLAR